MTVLDQAGLYSEAQRLIANLGSRWRTTPPTGTHRRRWELAHPLPFVDLVRGCNPWPGATTTVDGGTLTLWRARVVTAPPGAPGTLVPHGRGLAIAAGEDAVLPVEVQPESRRAIAWDEFLRGARLTAGHTLTSR